MYLLLLFSSAFNQFQKERGVFQQGKSQELFVTKCRRRAELLKGRACLCGQAFLN